MSIAIIDLGTNTFNLLIAEPDRERKTFRILLNTKEGVKLGEGGIDKKIITDKAFQRGIDAIARHYQRMASFKVEKVIGLATSAIRDAANGKDFVQALKKQFNLDVSIIPGDKEAELIYHGVKQTLPFSDKRFLLLDIGGGSNEFIIADNSSIFWKKSFRLGMARLLEKFKPSDPVSSAEIKNIETYLEQELEDLFKMANEWKPEIFIGASGSFDSFVAMLTPDHRLKHTDGQLFHRIPFDVYLDLHDKIIHSTKEEREKMAGLEPVRRDMIVLATIFVRFVLEKTGLKTIYQSAYSLKEGAIFEIMSQTDHNFNL